MVYDVLFSYIILIVEACVNMLSKEERETIIFLCLYSWETLARLQFYTFILEGESWMGTF